MPRKNTHARRRPRTRRPVSQIARRIRKDNQR